MDCQGIKKRKRIRNQICGLEDLFAKLNLSLKIENSLNLNNIKHTNSKVPKLTNFAKTETININYLFPCIKECKVVIQKYSIYSNINVRISSSLLSKKDAILPCILTITKVNNALSVLKANHNYDQLVSNHHLIICNSKLSKNIKTKRRKCANESKTNIKSYYKTNGRTCKNIMNVSLATTSKGFKQRQHIKFTRLNKPYDNPSKFNVMPCDMADCEGELSCRSQRSEIDYEVFNNKALTCRGFAFCALGCLCNSLDNSGKYRVKGHCHNYACAFGCKCGYYGNSEGIVVSSGSSQTIVPLNEKRNRKLPSVFRDNSFILHPHIKVSRSRKKYAKDLHLLMGSSKTEEISIPDKEKASVYPCSVIIQNVYDPVRSLILSR